MKKITDLKVYILAEELSDLIWDDFDDWPEKVKRTIGYQIIRSGDSVAANIAEGYGRFTPKDRKLFYRYARGSLEETKAWLRKLIKRNILTKERTGDYEKIINNLGPALNGFINSTK